MQAQTGLSVKMTYEVRSGECPDCGSAFEDRREWWRRLLRGLRSKRKTDSRWCPHCCGYRVGKLEQTGIIKEK